MRGRTNVGGGGISINATVEPKTIKSGSIIAGDFVEYYSTPVYIEQTQDVDFAFSFDEYDIAKINGMLTAFRDGEQKFTYAGYNCTSAQKYEDFIIFFDGIAKVIGVLSFSANGFSFVDTVSVVQSVPNVKNRIGICGGNGKICVFTDNAFTTDKSDFHVVDISQQGMLSNYKKTELTTSSNIRDCGKFVCYYNGRFYALAETQNPHGSSAVYANDYIYPLNINAENVVSKGASISTHFAGYSNLREVYRKDSIIIFSYDRYIEATTNNMEAFISVLNFTTGNYNEKQLPNKGSVLSYIKDSLFIANSVIRLGLPASATPFVANGLQLCVLDEETYEITVLDSITLDVDYEHYVIGENYYDSFIRQTPNNIALCNLDFAYAQCKGHVKFEIEEGVSFGYYSYLNDDKNLYLYDISQNVIQDIPQKNYVIPYSDGGHPIGVAKESGNINDVIDVYVPAV